MVELVAFMEDSVLRLSAKSCECSIRELEPEVNKERFLMIHLQTLLAKGTTSDDKQRWGFTKFPLLMEQNETSRDSLHHRPAPGKEELVFVRREQFKEGHWGFDKAFQSVGLKESPIQAQLISQESLCPLLTPTDITRCPTMGPPNI
ncbi:hypothetical protein chiPu_0014929 [Chiloscyllium punctatum]|uniref:Bcr-Abl oncoprotein oligomerisation domain-containing protein n=1 Tax=Chiloscyllium punctatum TaxID=137246 RepID=A0A401T1C7_CHIPU|nr:hypothetical protein [Chiloscyllium punctatum]